VGATGFASIGTDDDDMGLAVSADESSLRISAARRCR